MAGYEAPEGQVRIVDELGNGVGALEPDGGVRPGAVLDLEGRSLRLWTVDGSEDGELLDLPLHMPGWMASAGATFDLEGDFRLGRYHFHRTAFLSDDEAFGLLPDADAAR